MTAQIRTGQAKAKRDCFLAHSHQSEVDGRWKLSCHCCDVEIDAAEDEWIAEHMVLYWLTRDNTPSNVWPSCVPCATTKTARDKKEIAKTKRIVAARQSSGSEPKRSTIKSRGFEPGKSRKLQSRGFAKGQSRKLQSRGFQKPDRPDRSDRIAKFKPT